MTFGGIESSVVKKQVLKERFVDLIPFQKKKLFCFQRNWNAIKKFIFFEMESVFLAAYITDTKIGEYLIVLITHIK